MSRIPPMDKRFKKGEIVYWCHQHGHEYSVQYGIVNDQYDTIVYIDYLAFRERRRVSSEYVNNVPVKEFQTEQRFHKLPKGWTYNTRLFEIIYDESTEEERNFNYDVRNPVKIKEAYDKGFLVEKDKTFRGEIQTEITKEGWRLTTTFPMFQTLPPTHTSIGCEKVYRTYEEAAKEVNENKQEFIRQSELTDYEWSVEQIDKTLTKWKNLYGHTENEMQQYRDWILAQEKVEDIEVRIFGGEIQWKRWKYHKNWRNIETNM